MKDITKKEIVASLSKSWVKAQKKRCHKIRRQHDRKVCTDSYKEVGA